MLNTAQCLLILEDLQSSDQPFQTQQVIAIGRYIDLVENNVRCSRRPGVTLLFTDYLLLRGLSFEAETWLLLNVFVKVKVASAHKSILFHCNTVFTFRVEMKRDTE